jgi:hypothetical protein
MKVVIVEGTEAEVMHVLRDLQPEQKEKVVVVQPKEEKEEVKGHPRYKHLPDWVKQKISEAQKRRWARIYRERRREERRQQETQEIGSQGEGTIESRIPHKAPKSKYVLTQKRSIPAFGSKKWTKADNVALARFYKSAENHYANGIMRQEKLAAFAKSADRSQMAVAVRICNIGLNKMLVRGSEQQRRAKLTPEQVKRIRQGVLRAKEEKTMLRRHAHLPFDKEREALKTFYETTSHGGQKTAVAGFPDLVGVTVSKEIVMSVLKLFTLGERKRTMTYSQDAYAFGIDAVPAWKTFIVDVLLKSEQICEALKVPNRFSAEGQGAAMQLSYDKV